MVNFPPIPISILKPPAPPSNTQPSLGPGPSGDNIFDAVTGEVIHPPEPPSPGSGTLSYQYYLNELHQWQQQHGIDPQTNQQQELPPKPQQDFPKFIFGGGK